MAKILIAPLGAGRPIKNDSSSRSYKKANYQIDGQNYESSFVASVLYENKNLDGIIFIGTVKSMWEEVYSFFCRRNHRQLDEDYWMELAEKIDGLNYNSDLSELDLTPVQEVMGDRSQCILIKYGLNGEELWENFDRIIKVVNSLKAKDEVYIDITHSFRSLSMFLFLVLKLIEDLLPEKEIKVAGVYYGMLEVSGKAELGYAPIVDLQPLFQITDWIKGTYSFKTYGDGSLISKLLEKQGEIELSKSLEDFTKAVNIGYVPTVQTQVEKIQKRLKTRQISGPFKYLKKFVVGFLGRFDQQHESDLQLELAGWYFENQRYATGYLTMTEAILTYLCEVENKDPDDKKDREYVKNLTFNYPYKNYRISELYDKINKIRVNIAHPNIGQREKFTDDIEKAEEYQKELKSIFESETWGAKSKGG